MNLALSDVRYLARAFVEHYRSGNDERFESYARKCLDRIWRAEHFSWWMTSMLHRFEEYTPFQARIQRAELAYVTSSKAAASALAENYVGLPWQD